MATFLVRTLTLLLIVQYTVATSLEPTEQGSLDTAAIGKSNKRSKTISAKASSGNVCSGFGTLSVSGERCLCQDGFVGPTCNLRVLNALHPHGRFVGDGRCVHGSVVESNCICEQGWEGYHCNRPKCVNGKYGCAPGTKYCGAGSDPRLPKPVCNCRPGFYGVSCDSTTPPPAPKIEAKPACTAMKKCVNTGVFDSKTCGCTCTSPWTGDFCEQCEARSCLNGMVQDPNTCGCVCPASKTCEHYGVLDQDLCQCNCTGSWTGESCNKCDIPPPGKDVCNGHGAFSAEDCGCVCMPPWLPESQCKTCSLQGDKCLHGVYTAANCSCECSGLWTGELCDECPTEEELLVKGVDCGGREFERKTCQCTENCKSLNCQNGAKQNSTSCKCDCPKKTEAGQPAFWSGPECSVCTQPDPSPCGSKGFNTTTCSCEAGCERLECNNNGLFNQDACSCDCPAGWAGKLCEEKATGKTAALAGKSCKAIMLTSSNSTSGLYFVNPSGKDPVKNAFQVYCDMTGDGGGWLRLASVLDTLKTQNLGAAQYRDGLNEGPPNKEYILKCSKFNGMDMAMGTSKKLKNVMVRVKMGAVVDFFKPIEGESLCGMLTSLNKHLWSPNRGLDGSEASESESESKAVFMEEEETLGLAGSLRRLLSLESESPKANKGWFTPVYESNPALKDVLGGSEKKWPESIDGRMYISFWGGASSKGGCCHRSSKIFPGSVGGVDTGSWQQEFTLDIQETIASSSTDTPRF